MRQEVVQILRLGAIYFALVFGAGFVLGPIRILWLAPQVGTRWAELIESPIMLAVIIFGARWLILRFNLAAEWSVRLGIGLVALGLLLVAEFTLVLLVRGVSFAEYYATRDPVSGTVYIVMLGLFAVMPLLVSRG